MRDFNDKFIIKPVTLRSFTVLLNFDWSAGNDGL